jgi:hypothetical protein
VRSSSLLLCVDGASSLRPLGANVHPRPGPTRAERARRASGETLGDRPPLPKRDAFAPSPIDLDRHFRTPVNRGWRRRTMGRAWRVRRRTLPQSSFATVATRRRGEQSLTLQRPQARPARSLPRDGTDTRAVRFNEAGARAQALGSEMIVPRTGLVT